MNTRGVLGKKIVAVEHHTWRRNGRRRRAVVWLELEDGTRLFPHTYETEDAAEYMTDLVVNTTGRKKARGARPAAGKSATRAATKLQGGETVA